VTDAELLQRFSPYLQYDSLESFRADSAAELPEGFFDDGTTWSYTNTLRRKDGTVLAAADPAPGRTKLDLTFLAKTRYKNGVSVRRTDYLDAAGRRYVADARRMHADPRFANRAYGHVAREANGTRWAQYWFFYYYNDKNFLGIGLHEGDWEMIQLRIDAGDRPTVATFAQHSTGEAFSWTELQRRSSPDGPVPVVYVGRGSHASFASAGEHWPEFPIPPDYANGKGPRIRPALEVIEATTPGWAFWPGTWGSSGSSPRGPTDHGQWRDPAGFHREVGGSLTTGRRAGLAVARPAAALPAPPVPRLAVRRVDDRALVDFRFPTRVEPAARPEAIVLSVDSPDDDVPPSTRSFPVRARTGAVVHPTRLADRRYVVRAVAYGESGTASRVVSRRLPRAE
jgi:hypothetical protein